MNELQLALIGAGAAAVAAVWGYNVIQERKHRKLAEKVFGQPREDALMRGAAEAAPERVEPVTERIEPELERREPSFAADETAPVAAVPAAAPAAEVASADAEPALPEPPAQWADTIADCALRLEFVEPVAAPALWATQAGWADHVAKPLRWLGFDERSGWKLLTEHDAGHYAHVVAALQMADRQGPASDAEIGAFLEGVHQLAQSFSGLVDLPSRSDVLSHAQALDEFCAGVDVQLGVHIVDPAGNAFAGTKLRGLAEAAGMQLRDDGYYHLTDEAGETLFVLGNGGAELFTAEGMRTLATHDIVLTLDVPRAANGQAAFDRMIGLANQFALGLGGALVDAQRRAFDQGMIAGIRMKIGELQQRMSAHQIEPGSVRAMRLFS